MAYSPPQNVILVLSMILHLFTIVCANCTANCINVRREWPQFDFDFYYEHSGDGPPLGPSRVSYSVHTLTSPSPTSTQQHLSPSFTISVSSTFPTSSFSPATSSLPTSSSEPTSQHVSLGSTINIQPTKPLPSESSSSAANCPGDNSKANWTDSQTSNAKNLLENYLLRTVFRNNSNHSEESTRNLSTHFQNTLQTIYLQALDKQKEQLRNRNRRHLLASQVNQLNLTIWDLQVDDSLQTIDVIYYLQNNGVLVPYEDALKVMSFVSNEYIHNQTGYEVLHKVRRYNEDWVTSATTFNWLNWTSLIALLLLLILFILVVTLLYLKYRREKQKWLDTINKELNRVMPSHSQSGEDQSHWNYGQDEEPDEEDDEEDHSDGGGATFGQRDAGPSTSADKIDKSSQYDYSSFGGGRQSSAFERAASGPPAGYYRERLIPIGTGSINNPDYDRISYVRTQETLQETKKHPNILEIQLSKETQSIVQEIRKELNRYNFKKIIAQDTAHHTSTSEA